VWGYVLDAVDGVLLPLRGIPGSSTLGAPIELEFKLSRASMLDATHVVAMTANGDSLIVNLGVSPPEITAIPDLPGGASLIAIGVGGTSAIFSMTGLNGLWTVTGLPAKPHADFISLSNGPVLRAAVRSDGQMIVYSIADEGGESLYNWTASSSSSRFITSAASVSGIALLGENAFVADSGGNEVFGIWDVSGAATRHFIAGPDDGIANPVGLAVTSANRIHVSSASSATVMTFDFAGRSLGSHNCTCSVAGISLIRDSVFRLTDGVDRPIFLFDAGSDEGRIFFVPAIERPQ